MTRHVRRASWSEEYRSMSIQDRRALCTLLSVPYETTIRNPPSSFELMFINILIGAGYTSRSLVHPSKLTDTEFIYQYPVAGFRVDFALKDRLVEAYGCKYHNCKICGYGKRSSRKDIAREATIQNLSKLPMDIIWGHELYPDISRRLVGFVVK